MKFMDLLKYLNERFGEASTYASIAALLMVMHVSIPSATMAQITTWCTIAAGVLGVLLRENGKPAGQVVQDMLAQLVSAVKALPDNAGKIAAMLAMLVCVGLGITACATTPSQIAEDVSLIASGLHGAITIADPSAPAALSSALSDIATAADAFAGADSATEQSLAQRIQTDILAVASAAPTGNADVTDAIAAAKVLLASVDTAIGLPAPVGISTSAMAVANARARLEAYELRGTVARLGLH